MLYFTICILFIVWSFIIFVLIVDKLIPNRIYKGPVTSHFNGRCFHFPGFKKRNPWQIFWWLLTRKPIPWPKFRPLARQFPPPPAKHESLLVTFLGHASLLIQWNNFNILIDPVYQNELGPKFPSFFNIKGVHPPGVSFEDLPSIDLILISHNHYDHMDIDTLKELEFKHSPIILTGLGNKKILTQEGLQQVYALDWWQNFMLSEDFEILFLPAVHSSNRTIFDHDFTLWGGFGIKFKDKYIYYSGDTAYGPHFNEMREKLNSPSLAILPIGAYEPRWFMKSVHMNPEDMLEAVNCLNPHSVMAIHFGRFPLADEGIDEPAEKLCSLMEKEKISEEFIWIPKPGESREFP